MDERKFISDKLFERRGVRFDPKCITLSNASMTGLLVTLQALTDRGDEVLCVKPSYFGYASMLDLCGYCDVPAPAKDDFDVAMDAMRAAITPRTPCRAYQFTEPCDRAHVPARDTTPPRGDSHRGQRGEANCAALRWGVLLLCVQRRQVSFTT